MRVVAFITARSPSGRGLLFTLFEGGYNLGTRRRRGVVDRRELLARRRVGQTDFDVRPLFIPVLSAS